MRKTTPIDPKWLKEHFVYCPLSGQFSRRKASARLPAGHVISTKYPNTYISLTAAGKCVRAARAAWVYMTSKQPEGEIDHINGLRHDNRWANLRDVSHAENMKNTEAKRLGFTSVHAYRRAQKEKQ